MTHYSLVHKFLLMPQAMRILDAKEAVGKEWKKLETIPAWQLERVKCKLEAQGDKHEVRFATLMDICHLKIAGLETRSQKYESRVVLRGDFVKDDSGAYAAFIEQGSSAFQMTVAIVMDVIARLPGCDGQAADAVSGYTQVKMEDAPKLLKIPKSECPDIWIRLPRHKWPKSWANIEDPVVCRERNVYGHPVSKIKTVRRISIGAWMGKSALLGILVCSSKTRIILISIRG